MVFPCVKVNLRRISKCFAGIQRSVTFTITGRIKMIRACRLLNQYCIARISKKIQKNFPKFDGICRHNRKFRLYPGDKFNIGFNDGGSKG